MPHQRVKLDVAIVNRLYPGHVNESGENVRAIVFEFSGSVHSWGDILYFYYFDIHHIACPVFFSYSIIFVPVSIEVYKRTHIFFN